MGNPFKTMIFGYLMPILAAAIILFIPDYNQKFIKYVLVILVFLIVLPIVLLIRFPKNKRKAYLITVMYQLYAFVFFFTFPLIKLLNGYIIIQLLLVAFFLALYFLAKVDQKSKVPIVFPGDDKKMQWKGYAYYILVILLMILGLGGDYFLINFAFYLFGYEFMMPFGTIILYLLACWLIFFFSSLQYIHHVKERYLEKQ